MATAVLRRAAIELLTFDLYFNIISRMIEKIVATTIPKRFPGSTIVLKNLFFFLPIISKAVNYMNGYYRWDVKPCIDEGAGFDHSNDSSKFWSFIPWDDGYFFYATIAFLIDDLPFEFGWLGHFYSFMLYLSKGW